MGTRNDALHSNLPDCFSNPNENQTKTMVEPKSHGQNMLQKELLLHMKDWGNTYNKNHLERRLLHQAQARASYTPPFLGSFA